MGPVSWMAGNSVAANLIMAVLLIGGLIMGMNIKQEVFPEFSLDMVSIDIAYPGASPEEVENGIIRAVEEAIQDLEGIDEIVAVAGEGMGSITIEALEGTDINRLWQEVKSEVDRIGTFPDEAEDPQVTIAARKREVLSLALYGDASETTMRALADQIRDELLMDEGITQVDFEGVRDREIQVEISQQALRRYHITLQDVATTISRASVELGGAASRPGEEISFSGSRIAGIMPGNMPVFPLLPWKTGPACSWKTLPRLPKGLKIRTTGHPLTGKGPSSSKSIGWGTRPPPRWLPPAKPL